MNNNNIYKTIYCLPSGEIIKINRNNMNTLYVKYDIIKYILDYNKTTLSGWFCLDHNKNRLSVLNKLLTIKRNK